MSTARATHPVQGFARPMGISPMKGPTYDGAELATKPARATTGKEHPTRVGARLHWADGTVTDLDGMTIPQAVAPASTPASETRPYWPTVPARKWQEAPPAAEVPSKPASRPRPQTQFAPPAPPEPLAAPTTPPPRRPPPGPANEALDRAQVAITQAECAMALMAQTAALATEALQAANRAMLKLQEAHHD